MFASLRFLNSLVYTCSLRFEINFKTIDRVRFASISKKTSFSKLSLRFASMTLSFAFDVSERVYTIKACEIPGGVYNTGA